VGSPPNDHKWLASTPSNQGPFEYATAPVGPADHLPVPSAEMLALGN
jgi:hypothetical protein